MHLCFFCFLVQVLLVLKLICFFLMGTEMLLFRIIFQVIYMVSHLKVYFKYHYFETYLIIYFCLNLSFFIYHLQFILLKIHLFVMRYLFISEVIRILIVHLVSVMFMLEDWMKVGFIIFVNLILISFDLN